MMRGKLKNEITLNNKVLLILYSTFSAFFQSLSFSSSETYISFNFLWHADCGSIVKFKKQKVLSYTKFYS